MERPNQYRHLDESEIKILLRNGCECGNWGDIQVAEGFNAERIRNVAFSGINRLGVFNDSYTDTAGLTVETGIRNAHIHNCEIGSNVCIRNIGGYISNYKIEDGSSIINCGKIFVEGESGFGNGTRVAVIDETGGRSVPIWDRLSAQEAYMISLYRHRKEAVKTMEHLIMEYVRSVTSDRGVIGKNSILRDCGTIQNIKTGPGTVLEGALKLIDGSINSSGEAPIYIGSGAIMKHFIVCSGAVIEGSVVIENCFIGQGSLLKNHFSASNSLFFANCEGFLGEACSVFAGPYTVTHHKSTLLIAGYFSFMNVGSGTNQSNHMYKLGPMHQGIVGRGSKTSSNAYLLWPAHIGPFTFVKGSHYRNIDISSFPFSYLVGDDSGSVLMPALNLANIGTVRDSLKWPARDRRTDSKVLDKINFDILNPYTVGKMVEGRDILRELKSQREDDLPYYMYHNARIKGSLVNNGIKLYQMGINIYLGNVLMKRLENLELVSLRETVEKLATSSDKGMGEWVDISGLLAPKLVVDELLDNLERGKNPSLDQIERSLDEIALSYGDWEWNWVNQLIGKEEGKPINTYDANDFIRIIDRWKEDLSSIHNMLLNDAAKEFSRKSAIGFGMDGDETARNIDFKEVRGDFETHKVVVGLKERYDEDMGRADRLIEALRSL